MSKGNKKNISFVEANVMNISTKFSFIPLIASEEKIFDFFFFANLALGCHGNQSNSAGLDKIHMVGRGPLKEHFYKRFVKIFIMR